MDRADLLAFAQRDWALLELEKTRFWVGQKRSMTPAQRLELGEQLRRHARAVRPDWSQDEERSADLATHVRVTEALRRVLPGWSR